MKIIALTFLIFISCTELFSQNRIKFHNVDRTKTIFLDTSEVCNPNLIFTFSEQNPVYLGGFGALQTELNNKITVDKSLKGYVAVVFTINCNSKVFGVQIIDGLTTEFDKNLIDVLTSNQNWTSGKQAGKNIDTYIVLKLEIKNGKIKILNK